MKLLISFLMVSSVFSMRKIWKVGKFSTNHGPPVVHGGRFQAQMSKIRALLNEENQRAAGPGNRKTGRTAILLATYFS